MSKTIPDALLTDLIRYHLLDIKDPETEHRIKSALEAKVEAMGRRQEYAKRISDAKNNPSVKR